MNKRMEDILKLVNQVDLTSINTIADYKKWQHEDGSLKGLKVLIKKQKNIFQRELI